VKLALGGIGLMFTALVVGVVLLWPSQRTGAEPVQYGRDTCAHCRMHLSQPGFAAELRDHTGTLSKYDDIGCMLRAMVGMHYEVPEAWVEDHDSADLIPLLSATLVRASVETPMGHGLVAFREPSAADAFAHTHSGTVVAVEELLREAVRSGPRPRAGAAPDQQENS
jgi:NosL protein